MIDPTAIISPKAQVAEGVSIGPYCVIGDHVTIGEGTRIKSHVVIDAFVEIGANCTIFQYVSIGAEPQDLKFKNEESWVKIGDGCLIREFVTIHRGTHLGDGITQIGADSVLLAYTHIAHDCKLGDNVIMSNSATLGGHVTIGNHANIGGLVAIHQFVRIGDYAFVSGKSAVVKDVPPYVLAAGDRAELHGLNQVGLKRHDFQTNTLAQLKKAYRILFRIGLTLNEAIDRVSAEVEPIDEVKYLVAFITSSQRGITR